MNYSDVDESLKEIWAYYRDHKRITEETLMQVVDNYAVEINTSQDLNFKRWGNLLLPEHQMWARGDYMNNINVVKDYIKERLAWMDEKLEYVPKEMSVMEKISNISVWTSDNGIRINGISEPTNIEILDITGKIILMQTATKNDAFFALPKGMYIIRVDNQVFKCIIN